MDFSKSHKPKKSKKITQSTHFKEFRKLLIKLDTLLKEGKGNSTEADEIRDQMDKPWNHLTSSEQEQIRNMPAPKINKKKYT